MMEKWFNFCETVPDGDNLVVVPPGIKSKDSLFEVLAGGLHFPDYFGSNWDAFEECIRDLSWLPEGKIVVHHSDVPLSGDPANARTYLFILKDAVEKWQTSAGHDLKVSFPLQSQLVLERLIET